MGLLDNESTPPTAATILCIIGGTTAILLLLISRRAKKTSNEKKQRLAKESFRIRKSNLLAVSGRGPNKRKYKPKQQWRLKKCVGEVPSTNDSWLYRIIHVFKEYFGNDDGKTKTPTSKVQTKTYSSRLPAKINMDDYFNNVKVVGLDCEMVGGGKGGMISMLARCSVVTLDCIPIKQGDDTQPNAKIDDINQNLVVLYDKYVVPKGRITDYRTQWSGITKETYDSTTHDVPIVTFHQCQKEITELFSSIDGMSVVVVGHALENDFDALEIKVSYK